MYNFISYQEQANIHSFKNFCLLSIVNQIATIEKWSESF